MPAKEASVPSGGSTPRHLAQSGRRWRKVTATLAVVVIAALAATARLFVWPDRGMPPRVSAIVMLDTPGGTPGAAIRLAEQHRVPFLVISLGTPESGYGCPRPMAEVTLICFNPSPGTTQGEAEFVGRLARTYRWRSVAVVTITPQDTRARLRIERCFAGPVYVIPAPIALVSWPYELTYEWGALAKALVVQRSC